MCLHVNLCIQQTLVSKCVCVYVVVPVCVCFSACVCVLVHVCVVLCVSGASFFLDFTHTGPTPAVTLLRWATYDIL